MIEVPHVVDVSAQATAVIHMVVPAAEIRQVMGPGISEVVAAVAAQGLPHAGAWFTHHFRMSPEEFASRRVTIKPLGEMSLWDGLYGICLSHGYRHVGEIEYVRGVQGLGGLTI